MTAGPGQTKVGRGKVAAAGDIDLDTVRRFEEEPSWKRETDKIIVGYATVAGRDPIDLWQDALDQWRLNERQAASRNSAAEAATARLSDADREEARAEGRQLLEDAERAVPDRRSRPPGTRTPDRRRAQN